MFYWQLMVIQVTLWLNFVTRFIQGLAQFLLSRFTLHNKTVKITVSRVLPAESPELAV